MQRRRVPLIIHTNNSHRGQHAARHAASSRRGEDAELSGARHLGDTQRHSTDRGASKLAAQGLRPRLLRRDERKGGLRLVHHHRDSRGLVLREIIARRDQTQKLHEGEEIAGRSEEEL